MASFGDKLKFRVAFKDGAPIASILTLDYKDTVTFKYGCSDARWSNFFFFFFFCCCHLLRSAYCYTSETATSTPSGALARTRSLA